ncbi:copper homeostasis protein CutC [Clostridium fallax]|uniref:PF03932 family protein CutC n=1 Tax=Clostridium fallax TaxID=1533 RepID=A0A1M4SXV1_9CLOT|nr:copper homeostasis protein CutC [Clostridium fallax]SHE37018.1 copper homeostasis protein [Clostridium fallax]SQB08023.1 copper homeostasis protein [Clostridium fallax]
MFTFEACVKNLKEALKAEKLGANRIELCDNLSEGGTTPSYGTIIMAKQKLNIPIMVIVRPRGGDFLYSDVEFEIMKKEIELCKSLGIYGVVFGILNEDKNIDVKRTKDLVDLAKPMQVTFNMAFDEVYDKEKALEQLIKIGVDRVLTKGGAASATDGKEIIKNLIKKSNGKIIILPGGDITKNNYEAFGKYVGAEEFHGTKIVGKLD